MSGKAEIKALATDSVEEALIPEGVPRWGISPRLLLGIYLIVPLAWLIVMADLLYLGGTVRRVLPESPEELFWFTVVFVLPHILASQFSFYDRAYLAAYRKELLFGVPCILVAAGILSRFDEGSSGTIFIALTMWHVIAQQTGIAGLLAGSVGPAFVWWKWLTIALFIVGTTRVVGPATPWVGACVLGLTTLLTLRAARKARRRVGSAYLWATQSMSLSAALLSVAGYVFFAILIPRVIHDLTAWTFYLAHDHNRNRTDVHNLIYRSLRFSHLPIATLAVLLAVSINLVFEEGLGTWYHAIVVPLSLFHYYSESFMWKRGAIHRRQIGLA